MGVEAAFARKADLIVGSGVENHTEWQAGPLLLIIYFFFWWRENEHHADYFVKENSLWGNLGVQKKNPKKPSHNQACQRT